MVADRPEREEGSPKGEWARPKRRRAFPKREHGSPQWFGGDLGPKGEGLEGQASQRVVLQAPWASCKDGRERRG